MLVLLISLILSMNIVCYASPATPTNFNYIDELSDEEIEVFDYELFDDSTSSDRDIAEFIKDIFITALSEILPDEDEDIIDADIAAEPDVDLHLFAAPFALSDKPTHKNVVIYHGTFNNYPCDLIVPYSAYSNLDIVNNYIVNVGTSSITGKLLYDNNVLDPSNYDSYTYIINPIYGSTSNVYTYGSFNYRRHYYLNRTNNVYRISNEDMYGNFYVNDIDIYYSASERVLYTLYVLLLFMGVIFLWIRRH